MANELTLTGSLRFQKSGVDEQFNFTDQVDVSSTALVRQVLFIGTAEEQVSMGDVTSPGYVVAFNLDATNYVQIGATTGDYCIKLGAGQRAVFPLNGTTLFAKANAAQCSVLFLIFST
jgi:hypothetical protein